jgi:phosphonate transport system substrate-binding protein
LTRKNATTGLTGDRRLDYGLSVAAGFLSVAECEGTAVKRRVPCIYIAFLIVALLLIAAPKTEAQVKQTAGIKTLTLGVVYQSAPERVAEHFRPLVEYTARKLAPAGEIKSNVTVANSVARLIELVERGQVDFYLESAFPTYLINRSGTGKLLLRRWKGGIGEYRGILFTSKTSRITRLDDLPGKMIAFEDPGSTSGYFLPKLLLFEKRFLVTQKPDRSAKILSGEIGYIFAGSEKDVVNLVREEKVAAGAISNDDYASLDETSKAGLTVLAESGSVPRHLVSVRRNLPEAVTKRLKEILLNMHQDDEGQRILRQTDGTTKFDTLPGGEEAFRRRLNDLYQLRGQKK